LHKSISTGLNEATRFVVTEEQTEEEEEKKGRLKNR
jgi:hypothetical protein